jgi:[acyl-carrier-protein] S-malonyltransferase
MHIGENYMRNIAFIFPGQGAQAVGMGKEFYDTFEVSREVFDKAGEVTGLDLKTLCFEENPHLNITEYTQIAMLTTSIAILKAIEEKGISSKVNAGLSLGEYCALVASKVIGLEDAFRVVRRRGILMQEAVPVGGAMAAVMGLDAEAIEAVCKETEGIVSVANYNCPGQIVITGEEAAVAAASEQLKEAGARKIVPLKVSGPFHSKMLIEAGEKLKQGLEDVQISDIIIPYVSNVTAKYVTDKNQVKMLLEEQVSSSVKWQQSIEEMIAQGIDTFIEIGPGKTLSGFMRKINKDVTSLNVQNIQDLDKLIEVLG